MNLSMRPPVLERASGPWQRRELVRRTVAAVGFDGGVLAEAFATMLAEAGASIRVVHRDVRAFRDAAEAFGAQVSDSGEVLDGLVVDATRFTAASDLLALHEQLQAPVRRLAARGRLVVLAGPGPSAATYALDGFVRSAAKELGRKGTTAQLIVIESGAEARAAAIARFVLSARSAFITAQPIHATLLAAETSLAYVGALDRKVALVTGAGRGIGEAIATRLAEEGAHVICVDRPEEETAAASVARATRGSLLLADVGDPRSAERIAEHVRTRHGGIDIIVHNAGITRDRTFAKMGATEWSSVLEINLAAPVRITTALLPLVRDGGRVIALSSVAGIAGNVGQTSYAASKAGLIGYTTALARQLAPRGITANAIAPGFIETRMTAAIPFVIREAARRLSALGQGGQPLDVAEAVTFLAQPASAGVTGAVLRICGGALIGA